MSFLATNLLVIDSSGAADAQRLKANPDGVRQELPIGPLASRTGERRGLTQIDLRPLAPNPSEQRHHGA